MISFELGQHKYITPPNKVKCASLLYPGEMIFAAVRTSVEFHLDSELAAFLSGNSPGVRPALNWHLSKTRPLHDFVLVGYRNAMIASALFTVDNDTGVITVLDCETGCFL